MLTTTYPKKFLHINAQSLKNSVTTAAALTLVCAHAVFQTLSADIKKTQKDATLLFGYVVVNI